MARTLQLALGRSFLGAAAIASGVIQLVIGDFVRLQPKWPDYLPGESIWAYATGALLVVLGLAILCDFRTATAASILGAMLVAVFLLWGLPHALAVPGLDHPWRRGFMWTNPLKTLALAGGALLVAGRQRSAAPFLLAAFLAVCGIQHFVYAGFVDTLVPAWVPGGQRFWTCFTAVALICGAAGLLLPRTAGLAATCSALMIFLWVLMLHVPRAFMEASHANEAAGACEALALSGVTLMVAAMAGPALPPTRRTTASTA